MRVLVLCGRRDPQFPLSASRRLADAVPGAQLQWFDHSGHYPFLEEPAAFWAAVARFLGPEGVAGPDQDPRTTS
jgi:proline iminopeptidase